MHNHSIVHRALVTYSDERTGEIRVKIPAVTGISEVSISYIGRSSSNSIWIVPAIGEQITVSADDPSMTNVFWIHTDAISHSAHHRNYFEAMCTTDQVAQGYNIGGVWTGSYMFTTYDTVLFSEGIRLVDDYKITFDYEGVYNLQFSYQWKNTETKNNDTVVFIRYNGVQYPNSSTYTSIPSSHGGVPGTAVTAINFVGKAYAGDYVDLQWASNSDHVSNETINTGSITGIPALVPTSPAVIVTVTQVA